MKYISFTNYIKARKCKASVVTPSRLLGKSTPRLYSKRQIVGFLFHEIKEKSTESNLLDDHSSYLKFLDEFKKKYSNSFDFDSLPNLDLWSETNEILGYMMDMCDEEQEKPENVFGIRREQDFVSNDKLVFAKPDLVLEKEDEVIIYDFKSGKLNDSNGETKEEYIIQLHFYAGVLNDHYGERVYKGVLESYLEATKRLSLDMEYSKNIIADAKKIREQLNDLFPDKQVPFETFNENATYDMNNCKFCNVRAFCKVYQNDHVPPADEQLYCFSGIVESVDWPGEGKFATIIIALGEKSISIKSIPSKFAKLVSKGQLICLNDVKFVSDGEYNYLPWSRLEVYE